MTEDVSVKQPVRKLTVKNFSVIEDAELEFGKITVLIGPQSSGKSLLCKLAYFLSKEVVDIATGRAANGFGFSELERDITKNFLHWFPYTGWGNREMEITYTSNDYEISVCGFYDATNATPVIRLKFSKDFRREYHHQVSDFQLPPSVSALSAIPRLLAQDRFTTYIPSERSFFVDTQKGYKLLGSTPDAIFSRFAELYAASLQPDLLNGLLSTYLDGELVRGEDSWQFAFRDGRKLSLAQLSTGSKELLPLLSVLGMHALFLGRGIIAIMQPGATSEPPIQLGEFYIEEPEAHVFPGTQYKVVKYFSELVNDEALGMAFCITTHSPYILSAFNNLIEASQVAIAKPELTGEVAKLIPEKFWVKSSDFKAYCIDNGKLESIMDKESGLISSNYLDSVSDTIGAEFDELLRLGYVEA